MSISIKSNQKLLCYALGVNDFKYNEKLNSYQGIIINPSLKRYSSISVKIFNHEYSSDYFCTDGKLIILTRRKPKTSINVRLIMDLEV